MVPKRPYSGSRQSENNSGSYRCEIHSPTVAQLKLDKTYETWMGSQRPTLIYLAAPCCLGRGCAPVLFDLCSQIRLVASPATQLFKPILSGCGTTSTLSHACNWRGQGSCGVMSGHNMGQELDVLCLGSASKSLWKNQAFKKTSIQTC